MAKPRHNPSPDRLHAAVAYLRRSTEQQERSLGDQEAVVRRYADEHGLRILRTYTDDAISGTQTRMRTAFNRLIADAQAADRDFDTVLVYDIKRFGRVDNDEAGHYRWLLRRRGVRIVYVAEGFVGGSMDDLIRPVKQWQAREESRDLARLVIRGQVAKYTDLISRGTWLGGMPPHGYDLRYETIDGFVRFHVRYERDGTKLLLTPEGGLIQRLSRGEPHVVSKRDVCRLTPSEPIRVATVRRIFELRVTLAMRLFEISKVLQREGWPTARGPGWRPGSRGEWCNMVVDNMLRQHAYAGDIVWNRRSLAKFFRVSNGVATERLDADIRRTFDNPKSDWLMCRDAHVALVSRDVWGRAQAPDL